MIPGLDKIFALFGAMSGSLVVYILPALFYRSIALKSGVLLGSGLFPCRKNTGTPRSRRRRRTTPAMAVFGAAVHGKDDDRDHLLGGDLYEEDSVAGGIDIDGNPAATPPTFLTLVMVYVNCMVGVLLFGIGTSFALADLFIHETDKP